MRASAIVTGMLEAFGHRLAHRDPRGVPGQFEGEGGDAQRPAGQHARDVVHAAQETADADHGDQVVQPGRGGVIGRLQRRPLQPHQKKQQGKEDSRCCNNTERGQVPPGSG
jgi:hypothetical protein